MATQLVAVDQSIIFADTSVPEALVDAYKYTQTFAQAVARKINPDPATDEYFKAMTEELVKLAWNVTGAGKLDYGLQQNRIRPADIVKSILNPYLSADQQRQLAGIVHAIQQPDTSMTGFLDFWWKKAATHADKANMAFGPLTQRENSANITMIHYGFNFDATSWRSLFVESSSASLQVVARNLEMNLNLAMYNSQVKDSIIAKLAGKEAAHIANTVLDL